jgi:hypothetical protein
MPAKPLKTVAQTSQAQRTPAPEDMQTWIAEAAYYRAQNRGFEPGGETQDWLAAEAEVLARLRGSARAT